jgi:Pretoxin HINT domain
MASVKKYLNLGCFVAGTKLWTPGGYRSIETLLPGDLVYSRDEWNPSAAVEAKVVEEVFTRFAGILHVHLGGQVIGTSGEHPFYVDGRGWVPAGELQPGEYVLCADGSRVLVEEVYDTGEWQPVYNLRVADHHTYFIGEESWGWNAWVHNAYKITNSQTAIFEDLTNGSRTRVGRRANITDSNSTYNKQWFIPTGQEQAENAKRTACSDNRSGIGDLLQTFVETTNAAWKALPNSNTDKYTDSQKTKITAWVNEMIALRNNYGLPSITVDNFLNGQNFSLLPPTTTQADRTRDGQLLRLAASLRASAQGMYIHGRVKVYCNTRGYTYSDVGVDVVVAAESAGGYVERRYEILRDTDGCWQRHYRQTMNTISWRGIVYT